MSVIDVHCHILPGVDDGSSSLEMTYKMLQLSAQQGVDYIIATPHFYADRNNLVKFSEKRDAAIMKLSGMNMEGFPQLRRGAEVAFYHGIGNSDGVKEVLCVENTNALLLEMPFQAWDKRVLYEVEKLCYKGIVPVIAHLERFVSLQKDKNMIYELLSLPVIPQFNAEALLSWGTRRFVLKLIRQEYDCLLGSDAHNLTSRIPNLSEGRRIIRKKCGEEQLMQMDQLAENLFL